MPSSPTIDGHSAASFSGGSSQSIALTTSLTNDVIVLCIFQENTTARSVTGVSGGGLTWASRGGSSRATNTKDRLEIWWAQATSALAATSLTVTLDGATDDWTIVAFGANGCASPPWDSNGGLPAHDNTTVNSSPPSCTISTSSADCLLIAVVGSAHNNSTEQTSIPTGYTAIDHSGTNGGAIFSQASAASKSVSSTQSSVAVAWGASIGTDPIMLVDALTADSASTPLSGSASLSSASTVTASGQVSEQGASSMGSASSLAASGRVDQIGSASPSSVSTLSASGMLSLSAAASLSSSSTLAASGRADQQGSAALSGSSTIAASGRISLSGSASLGSVSTLAASGQSALSGSATLSSVSTLAASGRASLSGSASLASSSTLLAAGVLALSGSASLGSTSTLSAAGAISLAGSASLSSTSTLAAAGITALAGSAALGSSSTLMASGSLLNPRHGSASLHSVSSLAAAGVNTVDATVHPSAPLTIFVIH